MIHVVKRSCTLHEFYILLIVLLLIDWTIDWFLYCRNNLGILLSPMALPALMYVMNIYMYLIFDQWPGNILSWIIVSIQSQPKENYGEFRCKAYENEFQILYQIWHIKKNWERLYNIAFRDDDDYCLFQFGFLNFTHLYRYLHVVEVL